MKKTLLIISVVITFLFISQKITAQSLQTIPIQSGFNADVIANGVGTSASSTTTDVDGVSFAFVSRDFQLTASSAALTYGLPINGLINSVITTPAGLSYQLAPYSGNNSLRLQNASDSGTLVLTTPIAAFNLYMLATGGSGACNVDVTLNFADATTQTVSNIAISDWYNATNFAIQGIGRINRTNDVLETGGGTNPRLYQIPLAVTATNQSKLIQSITITKVGTGGIPNIFAFSAEAYTTCLAPTTITYNATSDGGAFNWTASTSAPSGYEYAVTTSATLPSSGTSITNTSTVISGLTPQTTYYFHVRSVCSGGTFGFWVSTPFTTACAGVANFTQNFDASATGVGNLPTCWAKAGTSANVYNTTGSVAPMSPSNRLYMNISATTSAFAVLPPVTNLQNGTHRLKFKGYATAASKKVRVGYFTNPTDINTYVLLQELDLPGTTAATAIEFTVIPTGVPAGVTNLVLRLVEGTTTTAYFDDFKWEAIPACPDSTGLVVGGVTSSGANTSWDALTGVTGYEYAVTTSATPPTSGTATTNTFAVISGLAPQTLYYLHVRATCTAGTFGAWTTSNSFTTLCAPVSVFPWNEGFEGITTVGTTAFPPCWLKENGDYASAVAGTYNTPNTGTKYLRDSWSATNEYMWTPGFNLVAGTSYDFSSYIQGDGFTGWTVDYFVNGTQNSAGATQVGTQYSVPGTGTIAIQSYSYVTRTFVPTTSGTYYFAVRVNQSSGTPWYVAFDDFELKLTPACPVQTGLISSGVTSTGANVSWDAMPAATGYEYAVTTSATPPTSGTSTTNTFAIISGLSPQTVYYLHVRALCSGGTTGNWASPVSFTTLCADVTSFVQNFDGVTASTLPSGMPNCWAKVGSLGSCYTSTTTPVGSAPNVIYMFGTATAAPTMRMQPVSNLGAGTHRIKFKMRSSSTTVFPNIDFGYLTDPYDAATFVSLTSLATTGTTMNTYTYSPPAGTYSNYPAVKMNGTVYGTVYLDDFIWEPNPACPDQTGVVVGAVTSTGANSSWDAIVGAAGYEYAVTTSATPPASGTLTTATFAVLSGLTPQTLYYLHVRAMCSAGVYGNWASTSFTTACAPIVTLPWTEGFEGVATVGTTNFPPCWFKENGDYSTAITGTYNTPHAGVNYLRDAWSATNEYMWTPGFNLTAGTSYDFSSFIQGDGGTGWTVDYFVNTTQNSTGATQLGGQYAVPGSGTIAIQTYTQVTRSFVPTTSGTYYFAVRTNQASSAPWYTAFDDFELKLSPACPTPSASASPVTSAAATLTWSAVPSATVGYEYVLNTVATDPTGTGTATTALTYSATALTQLTQYYFHIRSVCSTGVFSTWSTTSFTTLATPPVNDNCANAIVLTPGGTFATNPLIASNVGATNSTPPAPGCALFNGGDVWYSVVVPASGSITVETNSDTGPIADTGMAVYSGTCAGLVLVECDDDDSADGNFSLIALTNRTPGEVLYVNAWEYGNDAFGTFKISAYDASLGTNSFNNNNFTIYPNPVKNILNINYNDNITKIQVINMLGQEIITKSVNNTQNQIDMSGLIQGTYLLKVTANDVVKTIKVIKE